MHYSDALWLPVLQHTSPSGPGHQRTTNRWVRVVQSLRNRIAHHEKVFKTPFKDTRLTPAELHDPCIELGRFAQST